MLRLFVAVVGLFTASLSAAELPRTLAVFLDQSSSQSSTISLTLQRELARVVAPLGLEVNWKKLSERTLGEDFDQLVVVRLDGSCSADLQPSKPAPTGQRRLASAAVSNGSVLPFASIECDNLKRTIASGLIGQRVEVQEQRLGRAMARVLAHELYHVLGATRHHHEKGVSKACFGPNDLLSDDFSLDNVALAQMRLTPPRVSPVEEPVIDLTDSSGR